jgi:DNA modification methylase
MVHDFNRIIEKAYAQVEGARAPDFEEIRRRRDPRAAEGAHSAVICSDFLSAYAYMQERIDEGTLPQAGLVYMDPPFLTGNNHTAPIKLRSGDEVFKLERSAYSDKLDFHDYLTMIASALIAGRELLSYRGSLWIHLDSRTVHYAKVLADEIFAGRDRLVNEIIWYYKSGGSGMKRFSNKHDTLLFYAKSPGSLLFKPQIEKSYNRGMRPYRFKGVREYRDDLGWYTLVSMKDVWEIPMVGRTSKERTGYASQKPLALLERIITACTDEGDLCVDLFGGSGTLAAAAEKQGRRWMTVDRSPLATAITEKRLAEMTRNPFVLLKAPGASASTDASTDSGAGASTDSGAPEVRINAAGATEVETMLAGPGLTLLIESYRPSKRAAGEMTAAEHEQVVAAADYDPSQFIALADVIEREGEANLRLVDIFGDETLLPLT